MVEISKKSLNDSKKKTKSPKKKKKKLFHVFLQGEQDGSKNFQKKVCRADFDVRAPYVVSNSKKKYVENIIDAAGLRKK